MRGLGCGSVIDPVAGNRDELAVGLRCFDQRQFLRRLEPRQDGCRGEPVTQRASWKRRSLCPGRNFARISTS